MKNRSIGQCEKEADKKCMLAEKSGSIILFREAIIYYKQALLESPDSIPIYLSIMHCYEEIIKQSDLVSQQRKYASLIIHEINCQKLYDKTIKPRDLFDLHYISFNAYKMLGDHINAEKQANNIVKIFEQDKEEFNKPYLSKFKMDYQEALSYLVKNKKTGLKRKRSSLEEADSFQVSTVSSDISITINNLATTKVDHFHGPAKIVINQININLDKAKSRKKKGKEKSDISHAKKAEKRVEMVNGAIMVDGRKSSAKAAGITYVKGVPFHDGVEIVDHGACTPSSSIEKRAKMNEAVLPALKKQKHEKSHEEVMEGEHLPSPSDHRLDIKKSVLYMPPIRRFQLLVGNLSKQNLIEINRIIQSEMDKFVESTIQTVVIKEHRVKQTPAPSLKKIQKYNSAKMKVKIQKANTEFNEAYAAYANGDYKNSLMNLLSTLKLCQSLTKVDKKNIETHKSNLLFIAHYMEYISTLAIDKCRVETAETFPEAADSVTTLLIEDLIYRDPCDYPSISPQSQPSQAEFKYLQQIFPATDLTASETCETYSHATEKHQNAPSNKSNRSKQVKAIIDRHQFRQPRAEAKSIKSSPQDLYISINARTITDVLNEEQVVRLVSGVCHLVAAHAEEKNSKSLIKGKTKPVTKRFRQYISDDSIPSVSEQSSTLFHHAKHQAKPKCRRFVEDKRQVLSKNA